MGASTVHVKRDSNLVISQIASDFRIRSWEMCPFHLVAVQLMGEFDDVQVSYMPRECNHQANQMAKVGSDQDPQLIWNLL